MRRPATKTSPALAFSSPAMMRSVVVLPQPDGPSRQTVSPARDGEVHVVNGGERAEVLGDALELYGRHLCRVTA